MILLFQKFAANSFFLDNRHLYVSDGVILI